MCASHNKYTSGLYLLPSKIWLKSRFFYRRLAIHITRLRAIMRQKRRHLHNRKYITYRNMHKIGEIRLCGFRVMRADRQTDKQT